MTLSQPRTLLHRWLCILLAGMLAWGLAAASAENAFSRELKLGDQGEDVRLMQQRLFDLGYPVSAPDGMFSEETERALILFQEFNNLLMTGTLDETTHRVLFSKQAQAYEEPMILEDALERMAGVPAPSGALVSFQMQEFNTNEYNFVPENRFVSVLTSSLSTFAADVDTASYAQVRAMILRGDPVPRDSVRVEEFLNYFHYDYKQPDAGEPFGVTMRMTQTPWNEHTLLLQIGLQAAEIPKEERPPQNLVFLIDVSGSMDAPDKLPLVKRAFQLLVEELAPTDTVSIVTYASRDEVVLRGVRASEKTRILEAIEALTAGGATAGAAGITTAYDIAQELLIAGGNNRVLLATDGDLNVGISDEGSLVRLIKEKKQAGIFLSVLGFGDGNYKDNKLEALADHGDGNYSYIDTIFEARRALVTEIGATFFAVAKDVKLQVDFNPAALKGYRLIGYENRLMEAEDFADDTKDGGELGSGHRLTVLYELVPIDSEFDIGTVQSKYIQPASSDEAPAEWLTLSIRAKQPEGNESQLFTYPLPIDTPQEMTDNLRFAAAVAQVGMLLTDSEWKGSASYDSALSLLRQDTSLSGDVFKEEFLYLVNLLARGQ
ncbi:MAG: YfbK domain-containing protein [Christensenellales bacterium]|jgi:Ca-activated chloride channel family protein